MVHSPSWEANWFAASQEIPRISQNPKVHYRTDKRLPPVSILGQPNPVHIPTSHLLQIHPNIIHTSTPRSPLWSPSLWFPYQDPIQSTSPHPYAPHAQPISFFSMRWAGHVCTFQKTVEVTQVLLTPDKNNGYFIWKSMYIYDNM